MSANLNSNQELWLRATNIGGVPSTITAVFVANMANQLESKSSTSQSPYLVGGPDLNVTLPITLSVGASTGSIVGCKTGVTGCDTMIESAAYLYSSGAVVTGTTTTGTTPTVLKDTALTGVSANSLLGDVLVYTSGPANGESQAIMANNATTMTTAVFAPNAPTPTGGDTFEVVQPIYVELVTAAGNTFFAQFPGPASGEISLGSTTIIVSSTSTQIVNSVTSSTASVNSVTSTTLTSNSTVNGGLGAGTNSLAVAMSACPGAASPPAPVVTGTTTTGTTPTVLSDSGLAGVTLNSLKGDSLIYTSGPANGESQVITANTASPGVTITTAAFTPNAPTSTGGDTFEVEPPWSVPTAGETCPLIVPPATAPAVTVYQGGEVVLAIAVTNYAPITLNVYLNVQYIATNGGSLAPDGPYACTGGQTSSSGINPGDTVEFYCTYSGNVGSSGGSVTFIGYAVGTYTASGGPVTITSAETTSNPVSLGNPANNLTGPFSVNYFVFNYVSSTQTTPALATTLSHTNTYLAFQVSVTNTANSSVTVLQYSYLQFFRIQQEMDFYIVNGAPVYPAHTISAYNCITNSPSAPSGSTCAVPQTTCTTQIDGCVPIGGTQTLTFAACAPDTSDWQWENNNGASSYGGACGGNNVSGFNAPEGMVGFIVVVYTVYHPAITGPGGHSAYWATFSQTLPFVGLFIS